MLDASHQPTDVFGRRVDQPPLKPGTGVTMSTSDRGWKLVAEESGYLYLETCVDDGVECLRMAIRSPIEVGRGGLHADFICLPTLNRSNAPSAMDVQQIVSAHGICCGIDPVACTRVSATLSAPKEATAIETEARGRRPEHGRDGMLTQADGDRLPAPESLLDPVWPTGMSVRAGSVLAVLVLRQPAAPGTPSWETASMPSPGNRYP